MLWTYNFILSSADEIPLSRPKKKKPKGKTPLGKVLPRLTTLRVIQGDSCVVAKLLTDTWFSWFLVLSFWVVFSANLLQFILYWMTAVFFSKVLSF